nr:hypothetical protein [Nocardia panacis]
MSTLAWLWRRSADCGRWWPKPMSGEARFVVLVARETVAGLAAADALLRQHHAGLAGASRVVGLVTVAARPGRTSAVIRRDLTLYSSLVDRWWRIGWHEPFIQQPLDALPRGGVEDESSTVPKDVVRAGREVAAVVEQLNSDARTEERGL